MKVNVDKGQTCKPDIRVGDMFVRLKGNAHVGDTYILVNNHRIKGLLNMSGNSYDTLCDDFREAQKEIQTRVMNGEFEHYSKEEYELKFIKK